MGTHGPGRASLSAREVVLAATLAMSLGLSLPAVGEPFVPQDDGLVLERLPRSVIAADRELAALRKRHREAPDDLVAAVPLARKYITLAQAAADPRWMGYAQATLAPWWEARAAPVPVLTLRAMIHQNRHDFDPALDDLDAALAVDPRNGQAWLIRAMILRVQGRHDEALASCRRLFAVLPDPRPATACISDVAGLAGQARRSYQALAPLAGRAMERDAGQQDAGLAVWVLSVLGDLAARLGDAEAAERHYRRGLSIDRDHVPLLAAYADFLLDEGRPAAVRDVLIDRTRPDPLLLRLALAQRALGLASAADSIARLTERFAAARARGEIIHQREEARFTLHLLGDARDALRLAAENWQVQREPQDARILLEAALAAGVPARAAGVLRWLEKTGLEDQAIAALVERLERAGSS